MRRLAILTGLAALGLAGCSISATAHDAPAPPLEPASPRYLDPDDPGKITGYVCWSDTGYSMPQPEPLCPPGWHGAPPEQPLPVWPGIGAPVP